MHEPLWVFGYGSLIWNPGFDVTEKRVARLSGWRRSFCMRSIHHRGTDTEPGLVLALDRAEGSACAGVALQVARGGEDEAIAMLRERELVSAAYLEDWLPVILDDDRSVTALAYVIDPGHVQYCGGLALEDQAQVIARAVGGRGANRDYLYSTAEHLDRLGIGDDDLEWLAARVRQIGQQTRE